MAGETRRLAEFASELALRRDPGGGDCHHQSLPCRYGGRCAVRQQSAVEPRGRGLRASCRRWRQQHGPEPCNSRKSSAPAAALANGTFAHAFEFDNLRQPSIGVHPGSTATVGALAVAEEQKVSGRDFLTALVAGNECMLRTGLAAKSTSEPMGFHAPGQTGVFGSAIAASRIMGHDAQKTAMAIGIGGSLCSGLLAFAKAGNGGMVKRLHMGRAAEGGVTAACLAARGFEGPDVLLEGKFGYLDVHADNGDPRLLTEGLGTKWESLNIWFRDVSLPRHRAIAGARDHGSSARASFRSGRCRAHRARRVGEGAVAPRRPQPTRRRHRAGSVLFSVALSLFRDPGDPRAFLDGPDQDPRILAMCRKIELRSLAARADAGYNAACGIEVTLADGRTVRRRARASTMTALMATTGRSNTNSGNRRARCPMIDATPCSPSSRESSCTRSTGFWASNAVWRGYFSDGADGRFFFVYRQFGPGFMAIEGRVGPMSEVSGQRPVRTHKGLQPVRLGGVCARRDSWEVHSSWSPYVPNFAEICATYQRAFSKMTFAGSNPPTPASQSGFPGPFPFFRNNSDTAGR